MAKTIHYIDPSADTVIILTDPLRDFAVWEYNDNDNKEGNILDLEVQWLQEEVEAEAALVAGEEDGTHEDTNEPISAPDIAVDGSNPGEDGHEEQCGNGDGVNGSEQAAYENEIHFHVSSRHLRLASPQFSSLLSPETWQEGIRDETDGLYHVRASEWDETALLTLLNALHLRNSKVPRDVSLEMLAKIAMLVDYYVCGEAMILWTEMWIMRLKTTTPVPSTLCRDLMLWMCVAWVFKLPNEFANTTAVAITRSRLQELPTLGLPLVGFVDSIDQARNQAIEAILLRLHILREDFRSTKYTCPTEGRSFECGSILYGALTKELNAAGLLISDPVGPPVGMSLLRMRSKVTNIKSPVWGHAIHAGSNKYRTHSCNLQHMVAEIANRVVDGVKGLRLNDFKKP